MMSQESTKKGIIVLKPEHLPFSAIIQSGRTPKVDFGPFSAHKIAIPPYRYYILSVTCILTQLKPTQTGACEWRGVYS